MEQTPSSLVFVLVAAMSEALAVDSFNNMVRA
jgi:hypothetical protein